MNRSRLAFAWLAFACCACACSTTVRTEIAHAPAMPARVYPSIIVLHRGFPLEIGFAQNLAQHLSSTSDARVQVMDPQQIERSAPLPSGTIVVQIQIDSAESTRLAYVPTYGTACGWYSCYTTSAAVPVAVPTFMTRLTAQLRDGQTAQVLVTQVADEAGDAVRARMVLDRLYRNLVTWIDGPREVVEYDLRRVRNSRADRAIEAMKAGRFAEARAALETLGASGAPGRWKAKRQARFLFALAVARRFDPTTMGNVETHFGAAISACEAAARAKDSDDLEKLRAQLERDRAEARTFAAMNAEAARLRSNPPSAPIPATPPASTPGGPPAGTPGGPPAGTPGGPPARTPATPPAGTPVAPSAPNG